MLLNKFLENQIKFLKLPGNSLDLKSIENSRVIIKNRLRFKDSDNLTKLIEAVIVIWYHDEKVKKVAKTKSVSCQKKENKF